MNNTNNLTNSISNNNSNNQLNDTILIQEFIDEVLINPNRNIFCWVFDDSLIKFTPFFNELATGNFSINMFNKYPNMSKIIKDIYINIENFEKNNPGYTIINNMLSDKDIYEPSLEDAFYFKDNELAYQYRQMYEMEYGTWRFKKGRKIFKTIYGDNKSKEIHYATTCISEEELYIQDQELEWGTYILKKGRKIVHKCYGNKKQIDLNKLHNCKNEEDVMLQNKEFDWGKYVRKKGRKIVSKSFGIERERYIRRMKNIADYNWKMLGATPVSYLEDWKEIIENCCNKSYIESLIKLKNFYHISLNKEEIEYDTNHSFINKLFNCDNHNIKIDNNPIYDLYPDNYKRIYFLIRKMALNVIQLNINTKKIRTSESEIKVKKYNKTYKKDSKYIELDNNYQIWYEINRIIDNNKEEYNKYCNNVISNNTDDLLIKKSDINIVSLDKIKSMNTEIFEYNATEILIRFINYYCDITLETKNSKKKNTIKK